VYSRSKFGLHFMWWIDCPFWKRFWTGTWINILAATRRNIYCIAIDRRWLYSSTTVVVVDEATEWLKKMIYIHTAQCKLLSLSLDWEREREQLP
jgi:hypothetical protein